MAQVPKGVAAPADGGLPAAAVRTLAERPLGLYLHVPYCASICGYCDFNTYVATPADSGPRGHGDHLLEELRFARTVLGDTAPPVSTVFVGGGTPTLLGGDGLAALLRGAAEIFPLADGAEITTEANPETVDARLLDALLEAGYTRISIGMQSAAPHVLATLERQHTAGRALEAAAMARAAGFGHVSLDLIYGTPGESARDWDETLEAALSADPDHISAYALIVEPGTRLAAAVRRGTTPAPDDDELADRYERTDTRLAAAGFSWYEVSNWARSPTDRCRHNDGYWTAGNWWGAGPGAHSQIGGVRWWNTLSPKSWADAVTAGRSPAGGREPLTAEQQHLELVMLGVRRGDGLPLTALHPAGVAAAPALVDEGLLDAGALASGVAHLTLRGRMLADHVTLALAAG